MAIVLQADFEFSKESFGDLNKTILVEGELVLYSVEYRLRPIILKYG